MGVVFTNMLYSLKPDLVQIVILCALWPKHSTTMADPSPPSSPQTQTSEMVSCMSQTTGSFQTNWEQSLMYCCSSGLLLVVLLVQSAAEDGWEASEWLLGGDWFDMMARDGGG